MTDQAPTPKPAAITITLPALFSTMNPDAFFTFLAAGVTAFLPALIHIDPAAAPMAASIGDFCNTLSKDLAILGGALHLDGK
jgi:hypothetical protein